MPLTVMLIRDGKNGAIVKETIRDEISFFAITLVNEWGDSLADQHYDKFDGPALYRSFMEAVNDALRVLKEID